MRLATLVRQHPPTQRRSLVTAALVVGLGILLVPLVTTADVAPPAPAAPVAPQAAAALAPSGTPAPAAPVAAPTPAVAPSPGSGTLAPVAPASGVEAPAPVASAAPVAGPPGGAPSGLAPAPAPGLRGPHASRPALAPTPRPDGMTTLDPVAPAPATPRATTPRPDGPVGVPALAPAPSGTPRPPRSGAPTGTPAPAPRQLAPVPAPSAAPATAPAAAPIQSPLPEGKVTSPFGRRQRPVAPNIEVPEMHRGLDLAAPAGTPVRAPASGVVRTATERMPEGKGWGTVVVIRHDDGHESFFAHLGTFLVQEGQRVEQGAVVGTVGSTGRSTGPHLHWELRDAEGEPIDPMRYVGC